MEKYLKLYLVLETKMLKIPLEEFIPAVIKNGVTAIQLRDKDATAAERFRTGLKLKELIKDEDILFVINDRIDLALALDVNAVHLGVKDIPIGMIRTKFKNMIIGYSCNDLNDAAEAARYADYIGTGPAFFTGTKTDLRPVIGAAGIKEIVRAADRPAVAIGGINLSNILSLKGTGICGVAVSSCICASDDPAKETLILREKAELL